MQLNTSSEGGFGQVNFGEAQLGDRRRTQRLVALADRVAGHPGGTWPDKVKPIFYSCIRTFRARSLIRKDL